MSNTKIHKILMLEITAVDTDKKMSHHEKAICLNKLINVYNRTTANNLRAIRIADKLSGSVGDIATTLKRPELK